MGGAYAAAYVYQLPVDAFIVWGATDDVPLTAYLSLQDAQPGVNRSALWVRLMYERRVQKGEVQYEPTPTELGDFDKMGIV